MRKRATNVDTDEPPPGQTARVTTRPIELTEEAMRIHRAGLLIDGHNDLPWRIREKGRSSFDTLDISRHQDGLQTDIPRLRAGGVGAQFWAAYVPPEKIRTGGALLYAIEQIDLIHRMVRRYAEDLSMAFSADDIELIHTQGRIASLIGVEGGHAIENSLGALRMLYALGTRYMTLTHADTLDWVDAATDQPRHGGLTNFGEQVVLEMNRLGMMVDISHVSANSMRHVLRVSRTPIIASHSSADAVAHHPRNVPDDVLNAVAEGGGVVMVNFCAGFIHPEGAKIMQSVFDVMREARAKYPDDADYERAEEKWRQENPIPLTTVGTLIDHIDHIVKVAGIDHVGIGSDFDGVTELPTQLEDVSGYPYITQELLNRGYSTEYIHKVMGGNLLRTFRQVESLAGE